MSAPLAIVARCAPPLVIVAMLDRYAIVARFNPATAKAWPQPKPPITIWSA
jgi:hypothetical protein